MKATALGFRMSFCPTFGQWVDEILRAESKTRLWIPEGFAHGFVVLTAAAEVLYKTSDYWASEHERCMARNDKTLAISRPIQGEPVLSRKDARGDLFAEIKPFS